MKFTYHRGRSFNFLRTAVLSFSLLAACFRLSAVEEKLLCDFESIDCLAKFQEEIVCAVTGELPSSLDPEYLADFDKKYIVEIEYSEEHASQGDNSLKVDFAGAAGGYADYRILWFNLDLMQATDWSGWDAVEFDLYNPQPRDIIIRVRGHGPGGTAERPGERSVGRAVVGANFTVPPGWHRASISTRGPWRIAPEQVDRTAFSNFWIGKVGGSTDTVTVYLDNIRLVNRTTARLEKINETLTSLKTAPKGITDRLRRSAVSENASRLQQEAQKLLQTAMEAETASRIEEIVPALTDLESKTREVISAFIGEGLDFLTGETEGATLETAAGHTLKPLDLPEFGPSQRRLAALEKLDAALQRDLATTRQQAEIEKHFADEDFAIGLPPYPRAFYARPRDYSGPLGLAVELEAARHEVEPFQLLLLPKDEPMRNVSIKATDLTGPGIIDADNVEIAPMGFQWFPNEERWLANMLRPDITEFDVETDIQQPVWINVYVPDGTPAGEYHGTLTVSAENMRPQNIEIQLNVWPFSLPSQFSMKTAGASGFGDDHADDYARFLTSRRWNPHRLYMSGANSFHDYSYETFKQWNQWGGSFFNLFWTNHSYKEHSTLTERDEQGRLIGASDRAKNNLFQAMDPVLKPIIEENPDFLQHFTVYGFDEPVAEHMPVLEDLFGAVKERYGENLRTYFATHYPLWDQYGIADNIDIWAVTPNQLTREARDRLQAKGRQIIAYNIRSSHFDPVGNRVQFWSFFKSGYDGVLHYNPGTAGGEQVGRAAGPWEETLFPSEKRVDGGLHRSFPESAADKTSPFGWRYTTQTMSTVPFEYWREGLEDVEYLYLLRDLRDRLIAAGTDLDEHSRLIEQADRLVEVPENITTGALADQVEVEGEIIRGISGTTDSMSTIMAARRETAALIIRIKETLRELED